MGLCGELTRPRHLSHFVGERGADVRSRSPSSSARQGGDASGWRGRWKTTVGMDPSATQGGAVQREAGGDRRATPGAGYRPLVQSPHVRTLTPD